MGMTSDEFWHGNPRLAESYREANELKKEIKDYELWKQGMYIYEALLDVSPILHAFAKKGTKPHPYSDKPYGVKEKVSKEEEQKKVENERLKAQVHFMNLVKILQRKFRENKDGS